MKYKMNIFITEEEYIKFNEFVVFKSFYSKATGGFLKYLPVIFSIVTTILFYIIFGMNWFSNLYCIASVIEIIVHFFRIDKYTRKVVVKSLKISKKQGKLPYDSEMVLEFYDDKIIDISKSSKTELLYSAIERVSVLKDGTIYLHQNQAMSNIIPATIFNSGINYNEFLEFIKSKCSVIDYFEK